MRSSICRKRGSVALASAALVALASTGLAAPQGTPDVIVYDIGVDGGDVNDIEYYGQANGIAAYSIATQSCNSGTAALDWYDSGGDTRHPVIAQNMFRLRDGRFEQIGQSWLKHGFCAVNEFESQCGPCSNTSCDTLGVGCADTYWATLNDGRSGRSKTLVNAATGEHVDGGPSPTGNNTIRGRLQVHVEDINPNLNPGAEWFIEGQYVTADDAAAGADRNNASWRRVNVLSVSNINGGGATQRERPAIFAWPQYDTGVSIRTVFNTETGSNGNARTSYVLAWKVTQTSANSWDYEYALQNLTSDQSANSFSLTVAPEASCSNFGFHDVEYHSGDPYDGTDWPGLKDTGEIRWATDDYATNPNANALRWGTLYNFRFSSNYGPGLGSATIGLFRPDQNTAMVVDDVLVPLEAPAPFDKDPLPSMSPPAPGGTIIIPVTTSRNGSRFNRDDLETQSEAIVGRNWTANVNLDGASQSLLFVSMNGATEGTFTKMGELLIRPPYTSRAGAGSHTLAIPADPALHGTKFYAQAAKLTADGWKLTNALDVTIQLEGSN